MSDLRVVREFRAALLAAERRRRRRPTRRGLIVSLAALCVGAGIATAATGSLPIGAPIKAPAGHGSHLYDHPVQGSGRVARIRTPDPDGGPPWGIRDFKTNRGATCVEAGRVVEGRLGLVGDDGAFHEVPLGMRVCFGDGPRRPPRPSDGLLEYGGAGQATTPGAYTRHPCSDHIDTEGSFDPETVICDGREPRWVFTGTTGPRVVAIELRGAGVHERYPVVDRRVLIVRRGGQPSGIVIYTVFRDGHRRREGSTPHGRPPPEPPDPRTVRRARMHASPSEVGRHGLVTVHLRAPAPAESRYEDWYEVDLAGPSGCLRQEHVHFSVATSRRGGTGAPVRFGMRPPGPSLATPRAWCPGVYTGSALFRGRIPVGRFSFSVR
jgi:hypothetical protein